MQPNAQTSKEINISSEINNPASEAARNYRNQQKFAKRYFLITIFISLIFGILFLRPIWLIILIAGFALILGFTTLYLGNLYLNRSVKYGNTNIRIAGGTIYGTPRSTLEKEIAPVSDINKIIYIKKYHRSIITYGRAGEALFLINNNNKTILALFDDFSKVDKEKVAFFLRDQNKIQITEFEESNFTQIS